MNFGEWRLISLSDCIELVLVFISSDFYVCRTRQTNNLFRMILEAAIPYPMDPPRGRRFALRTRCTVHVDKNKLRRHVNTNQ